MTANSTTDFDTLQTLIEQEGVDAGLTMLAKFFRRDKKYHDLFEILKLTLRFKFGLPLADSDQNEDLTPQQRQSFEDGLVEACRDVGMALLNDGKIRESWMYLRPVVERAEMVRHLAQAPVNDENRDEMIEIALHEGIDVGRGYRLVLEHYGTCNAITTFQHFAHGQNSQDVQKPAAMLVEHVYQELLQSVQAHIEREEKTVPADESLSQLIADRPWLFGELSYHLDPSHLSSTIQAARCLHDPRYLRLAVEMANYGEKLHEQFQYPGEEPFLDLYSSHRLYFQALLGENQEEAVNYFHNRAKNLDAYQQGSQAAETYIDLLARIARPAEAISATIELIPDNVHTTGLAPDLLELARQSGNYEPVLKVYRQRDNLLGFATGLLQSAEPQITSPDA